MIRHSIAAALLAVSIPLFGAGFQDDFAGLPEGAPPAARWKPLSGEWKVREGKLVPGGAGDTLVLAADSGLEGSFRIEARIRIAEPVAAARASRAARSPARQCPSAHGRGSTAPSAAGSGRGS